MKKLTTLLSSIIAIVGFGLGVNAQCPAGQVDVTVDVSTDTWGYECYWELTPTGSACGTGTIGAYGNTVEVGCLGGGLQVAATGSGYGDNILTSCFPPTTSCRLCVKPVSVSARPVSFTGTIAATPALTNFSQRLARPNEKRPDGIAVVQLKREYPSADSVVTRSISKPGRRFTA